MVPAELGRGGLEARPAAKRRGGLCGDVAGLGSRVISRGWGGRHGWALGFGCRLGLRLGYRCWGPLDTKLNSNGAKTRAHFESLKMLRDRCVLMHGLVCISK